MSIARIFSHICSWQTSVCILSSYSHKSYEIWYSHCLQAVTYHTYDSKLHAHPLTLIYTPPLRLATVPITVANKVAYNRTWCLLHVECCRDPQRRWIIFANMLFWQMFLSAWTTRVLRLCIASPDSRTNTSLVHRVCQYPFSYVNVKRFTQKKKGEENRLQKRT